jgi:pimeloyl-ACP methyl ester carboxylesterase
VNPDAWALPPGIGPQVDALLSDGDGEAVAEMVFRELVMMRQEELIALRAQPSWPARVAAAQMIPREIGAVFEAPFDPEWAATITVPTLMLTGSDSRDPSTADIETVAAALPDARIVVLEGQEHVADILVPEVFAEKVVAFLRDQR